MTTATPLTLDSCYGEDSAAACEFSSANPGDMIWCVLLKNDDLPAEDLEAVNVFLGLNQYGDNADAAANVTVPAGMEVTINFDGVENGATYVAYCYSANEKASFMTNFEDTFSEL
jgi:hypothetical protein